ncbi:DUF1304 domain-containing protein [Lactobacillus corticis]|uniref:Membrane protein n=1 Tax=Lactobacillus corticis TaxID=2201249 RepID=A0A916QIM3_9LACO|nr:membrane protein [Lactobacillus corticis]
MNTVLSANGLVLTGIILTVLVAIEHIAIAWLEMFGQPEKQAKAFSMSLDFIKQPEAKISMANQGIYNFMLGVLLIAIYATLLAHFQIMLLMWRLVLGFIVIVAAYGGFTASKKIWLVQLLPAAIALVLISL